MTVATVAASPDAQRQLASLPLAVVLLTPDMQVASANPAAEQFLGQSARRLNGRSLSDILVFDDPKLIARLEGGEAPVSARGIDMLIAGVGHRRTDLTAAPVADTPGWQLLTLNDNSAIEALGDDPGGTNDSILRGPEILAHEIKNPLAGIRGAAQLLRRKIGEVDRAMTDLITAEVDRIATLIGQMQVLSGKTTSPVEACNPHEAIRRAVAVIDAAGESRGIDIREEFDPSLPPAFGNPNELVQVLINLISNAREACKGVKAARIVVGTRFSSGIQLQAGKSGSPVRLHFEIRVSDNGPGVPADVREHMFEPFVTSKKSGQGLGLALVRKLLHNMNGLIIHERDEKHGLTHFRIYLPLATAGDETHSQRKQAG